MYVGDRGRHRTVWHNGLARRVAAVAHTDTNTRLKHYIIHWYYCHILC